MTRWADLFTNRQLLALTTFSDLVIEARERVLSDTLAAGAPAGDRLESGGTDAEAYADAVATYLGDRDESWSRSTVVHLYVGLQSLQGASPGGIREAGDPDDLGPCGGQSFRALERHVARERRLGGEMHRSISREQGPSSRTPAGRSRGREHRCADLHGSAVLRQHRLFRSLRLLLRLAAPLTPQRAPQPSEHDARSEVGRACRQPLPPWRQGRREGLLRRRLPERLRARAGNRT